MSGSKLASALRAIDNTNKWAGKLASYLVLAIMLLTVYDVTMRYIVVSPTIWAWELSTYLYACHFLLAGGYVLLNKSHVSLDVLHNLLSPRKQAFLDLFTYLLFFLFVGLLVSQAGKMAMISWHNMERTATAWGPPFYLLKTILVISVVLLFLQGLAKWIRDLFFLIKGRQI